MPNALRWLRLAAATGLLMLATVPGVVSVASAHAPRALRNASSRRSCPSPLTRRLRPHEVLVAQARKASKARRRARRERRISSRRRSHRGFAHRTTRAYVGYFPRTGRLRATRAGSASSPHSRTDRCGSPTDTTGTTSSGGAGAVQSDLMAGSGGSGWDGYGGDSIPGANWRPYSDSSPFNQAVTDPTVVPSSQTYVDDALQWGGPADLATSANTTMDYSHPTYYAQPGDPTYTLHATGDWSQSIQGQQILIPTYAAPADGADAHMTVIEPDGWEYDFWQVQSMKNGVLTFTSGGRTMITGNGLGSGATAALFGNLAGVIRAPELAAGHIDHALFIVLKCASNDTGFGYGTTSSSGSNSSYVYPAEAGGSTCPAGESSVPLGTRFWLDMTSDQIQALDVPTYEKTVLTALATYGGYVGDTGGPGFAFEFESSMTYTQLGLPDPLRTLGQQLNLPSWDGDYVYNVSNDVNWQQYLKVITPPTQS